MADLAKEIAGAESQLNNLRYAKGSCGKPGAQFSAEEMDEQIAAQEALVEKLRAQTFA